MTQTILDCQTGEVFENQESDGWIWVSYHRIDENTLCVCGCYWGGPYHYQFFDMTDPSKGIPKLQIDALPKNDYVLMNNDVVGQKNYLDPMVEEDKVIFNIREERIKDGELDMEWSDFKYHDYFHSSGIIKCKKDYKDKLYFIPLSKLVLKREGNNMKVVEFWRSDEQVRRDEEEQLE